MKTMTKLIALGIAGAMLSAMLVGCSKDKTDAGSTATSENAATEVINNEDMLKMPDGVSLTEDQMKIAMSSYAGYMTQALADQGYTVEVRYDDDGSVHFDATKTDENGETTTTPDINQFDSLEDAFAYLYNVGQIDAEGNLLVSVSKSEEEAAAEAAADSAGEDTAPTEESVSEGEEESEADSAEDTGDSDVSEEDAAASESTDAAAEDTAAASEAE